MSLPTSIFEMLIITFNCGKRRKIFYKDPEMCVLCELKRNIRIGKKLLWIIFRKFSRKVAFNHFKNASYA